MIIIIILYLSVSLYYRVRGETRMMQLKKLIDSILIIELWVLVHTKNDAKNRISGALVTHQNNRNQPGV
jgi:hypothetical protein